MKELIKVTNLVKEYSIGNSSIYALNSINMTIIQNDFIALMGPSGSGKSTLLNILGCLDAPTTGEYWLDGQMIATFNNDQLAQFRNQKIGFIFQSFNLLPNYTALQNVQLPLIYAGIEKEERIERGVKALENVNLGNRLKHKPNQLSGGERQRIAIARALINNPSIILADEPTGNLDSKSSGTIINTIQQIHENGCTILLVTHDSNVASVAKQTLYMKDGMIV